MTRIAVTGLAVASPFGDSLEAFWAGLLDGPCPARPWTPRAFPELSCLVAALPGHPRDVAAVLTSLVRRALASAGLDGRRDFALALGSHFAETDFVGEEVIPGPMLASVAAALALTGPAVNTPIGCAAGNLSLAWALDRVRLGEVPFAVAGGFDLIGPGAAASFDMLGNLSEHAARPFDVDRDGIVLGEGGAMLVLEPLETARARGARVCCELVSAACAHDAEHQIRPALDGHGLASALRRALLEGGLEAGDVGYVNAHSPGTLVNDPCEAAAYRAVFGARSVPVGSTKAALGHAQGGANGLEAAACVLALQHQVIPPTLGLVNVEPALELDAVTAAREAPLHVVVSSASAMGGANAVVVMRSAGRESKAPAPHPVPLPYEGRGDSFSLVGRASWVEGEPPALKRASPAGRAIAALAQRFGPHSQRTGLYQAVGREKLELTGRFASRVLTKGFAGLKATAPVLEYSPYGPFVSLALELGARGPFWTLEADELAGAAALQQALTDLSLGRCDRALVGSCGLDATATLLVLERGAGFTARFSYGRLERGDAGAFHGLGAIADAIERKATASFRTPDGRGVTVSFT